MASSALLLTACAAPDLRDSEPPRESTSGSLEIFASSLPGRFGTATRLDEAAPGTIMILSARPYDERFLVLEFTEQRSDRSRGFLLMLERDSPAPFIAGEFVPLSASGSPVGRSCAMRFRLLQGLLSGETDPQSCRFGADDNSIGLLKEVALTKDQVIIADELTGAGQDPQTSPDILRLHRLPTFRGQARTRTPADRDWRAGDSIELEVGGPAVEPTDAAGMSLNVLISVRLIEGTEPAEPLIYLQISDVTNGVSAGQAWADGEARRLGLGQDNVQVDLVRQ